MASLAPGTPLRANEIQKGEYLARAADCVGCHTSNPSRPFAGGYRVPTPFGDVYSTNITPDPDTGIGRYSADEFVRAVQKGVRRDGADLYPAMPYDSFVGMNREDVLAIRAYLLTTAPISQPPPPNILPFPFNQRWTLWLWKLANLHAGGFGPNPSRTGAWNRGAYLVEVLGHCGACHTPRNTTFGMDEDRKLAGGSAGIWQAFNISGDKIAGIGGWSDEELFRFLKTGAMPGKAYAGGPMAETVMNSLQYLSDDDIHAIVAYLRTVPAQSGDEKRPRFAWTNPPAAARDAGTKTSVEGSGVAVGDDLYQSLCSGCHGLNGGGSADGTYPSLTNNSTLGVTSPENVVMTILEGVRAGGVAGRKSMAAFDGWLDDGQVAALANYVTARFGNPQVSVTAADVRQMRAGSTTEQTVLVLAAQGLVGGGIVFVLGLALLLARRLGLRRHQRHLTFVSRGRP
ncbi:MULTISPECIES: cytochrome c [unclassified Mesorhizobium]|uniref:cytochrome c n=1 Tax=unclassified Mesorhizobium TaxID=325217 RepID=UPI0011263CC1|nr:MULTISPECIES: cytochrome c [unclassified Mesorhizobium]MCA0054681.1 cytochrome c [Mesorhizobium sp. B261B1A]TPL14544.1 c-type cytochrome [Mesorhizobium sp. B2-4-11]